MRRFRTAAEIIRMRGREIAAEVQTAVRFLFQIPEHTIRLSVFTPMDHMECKRGRETARYRFPDREIIIVRGMHQNSASEILSIGTTRAVTGKILLNHALTDV